MFDHSGQHFVIVTTILKFNLKKLKELEGKEQYDVEVSNRFAALEHLDAEVEINNAWETIRENIEISAKQSRLF
jgi:hypothetical protein